MAEVSVVIPAYNAERYLEETGRSVLAQTYQDFEIIIVDDGSKDGTVALANRLAGEDSRITVLRNPRNQGVAETRNHGIRQATGTYIALLDSDDVWAPAKLEKQLDCLTRRNADGVYCSYDFMDELGQPMGKPFLVPPETSFRKMLAESVIGCSTMLVRADVLKAHPFNGAYYHEDYVLWLELLRAGCAFRGVADVLMHYRRVAGSRSDDKVHAAKKRWIIYRDYLKLPLPKRLWCFAGYAFHAVRKYYL